MREREWKNLDKWHALVVEIWLQLTLYKCLVANLFIQWFDNAFWVSLIIECMYSIHYAYIHTQVNPLHILYFMCVCACTVFPFDNVPCHFCIGRILYICAMLRQKGDEWWCSVFTQPHHWIRQHYIDSKEEEERKNGRIALMRVLSKISRS